MKTYKVIATCNDSETIKRIRDFSTDSYLGHMKPEYLADHLTRIGEGY